MIDSLKEMFIGHQAWRDECINLVASENAMSPMARKAIQSDMGQRYYFDDPYVQEGGVCYSYRGTKYISDVLREGQRLAQEIFGVEYASLYPISGHQANLGVLFAFCQKGDKFMCCDPYYGGYPGLDKDRLPKYLGLEAVYIPVDSNVPDMIDIEKTNVLIKKEKPKVIILSSAHTLFPIPMDDLVRVCNENGCILVYDASHPFGLIAGRQFQDPIGEGADILLGGTQKSFPGPQGGLILTTKYKEKVQEVEQFVLVDNPHFHRIGALTVTLLEIKHFGENYAKQTIKNTQCLAEQLSGRGLAVRYKELGFTRSHMFKLETFNDYQKFTANLESANIIMDNSGRVGCNEMTRYGMKEEQMAKIAEFIARIYDGQDPTMVKKEVIEFRKDFCEVGYCFEDKFDVDGKLK